MTAPTDLGSVALVKVEYWHKDKLGSLITTTDHTGAVTARYAYDPFGKRRYTSGTYDASGTLVVDWSPSLNFGTDRGFTGQEHLDDVGVVHMNGRLFDPMLGVYMQPNPSIGAPGDMQSYNRYGYCENNPLTCTDPSGLQSIHAVRSASAVRSFARESSLVSSSTYIGTAATDFAFVGTPRVVIIPRYSRSTSGSPQGTDGTNQPTPGCCDIAWLEQNKDFLISKGYDYYTILTNAQRMAGSSLEQEWALSQPDLDYISGSGVANGYGNADDDRAADQARNRRNTNDSLKRGASQEAANNTPEGLWRGGFASADDAAREALTSINATSIAVNTEFGGRIYRTADGDYGYTLPIMGSGTSINVFGAPIPVDSEYVGNYHTHGDYSTVSGNTVVRTSAARDEFDSNNFSNSVVQRGDIQVIDSIAARLHNPSFTGYLGTPSGVFKAYTPGSPVRVLPGPG